MRKEIVAISVVALFMLLGVTTGTSLKISENRLYNINPTMADTEIPLGSGTIFGDGVEENTEVDALTEKELIIRISSDQEYVDLVMDYDIECSGDLDQGRVYLFVQINGENLGNESVEIENTETGALRFDDVLLEVGDVLTYEIGVLYTNFDPFFTKADLDIGGAVIIKKARTITDRFYELPLIQLLLRMPFFARLFAL